MFKAFLVTEDYRAEYPDPIKISKGDSVVIGEKYEGNPDWNGWVWCINKAGSKGWVPENILIIEGNSGTAAEDYDAAELGAVKGEILECNKLTGGWAFCRNGKNEWGWIPESNLKQI